METQDFIKLLEDLKNAGFFYNDADFCRKMGIGTSRLSMMKTGKRPISEKFIHEIRETAREYPGGLLRLDPTFAYAEPPSS